METEALSTGRIVIKRPPGAGSDVPSQGRIEVQDQPPPHAGSGTSLADPEHPPPHFPPSPTCRETPTAETPALETRAWYFQPGNPESLTRDLGPCSREMWRERPA